MAKPQWQKVKQVVGSALERPAAERRAYLDQVCWHDSELRAEVESLLSAYPESGALLESPLPNSSADAGSQAQVIGSYRLLKEIGIGGMGQVWLAEQTEPIRRQVAVKLIRAGMYDSAAVQRFKAERQSLAIMDHPGIAKVFEAGTTPAGQPYLVMEYVDGQPITDYCDSKKLTIGERLQLFLRICEGVQHAHQKAIIHRDLKPSNVLVMEVDGKPTPRIIDFGLAKATAPLVPGETLFTQAGAFLGTPGYISPEQADFEGQDIDTRTDVYSLGVMLYELLTGFLPFDTTDWKKRRQEEILRQMREDDPPRPSAKVANNRETAMARAKARTTEVKQLANLLRGDLDWIVMKAIEKDRERRYATPLALATDIRKYLAHQPVEARGQTAGYRLQKYVRRHRVGAAVAASLAIMLATFVGLQTLELRRITRERNRADREAAAATAVSDFLVGLFKVSSPSEAKGNTITAREILDQGRARVETSLANQPELQARLMQTIGEVYWSLGLYSQAQPMVEKALETRRRVLGPEHPDTLTSMERVARTLERLGHYPEADRLARQTFVVRSRVLGPDHPDTIASKQGLANLALLEGHYGEAERLYREVLDSLRRVRGSEHPDTLKAMYSLALTLSPKGERRQCESLLRETIEIQSRVLGAEHPDTLVSLTSLAQTLNTEGSYVEAEKILRETLDAKRRVLGPEHSETLWSMFDLGMVMSRTGRTAEAEKILRQTFDLRRRLFGTGHPETLMSQIMLAEVLDDLHRYDEAERMYRDALATQIRVLGWEHPDTANTKYNLACNFALTGRRNEAIAMLQDAVDHGLRVDVDIEHDEDFKILRGDPRFHAILAHQRAKRPS